MISESGTGNLPEIISFFVSILVPKLMSDITQVKNLQDDAKKQLIIDTVKFFITTVYNELVSKGEISNDGTDQIIETAVLTVVTPSIDMFLDIQNGKLVLTPTALSFG